MRTTMLSITCGLALLTAGSAMAGSAGNSTDQQQRMAASRHPDRDLPRLLSRRHAPDPGQALQDECRMANLSRARPGRGSPRTDAQHVLQAVRLVWGGGALASPHRHRNQTAQEDFGARRQHVEARAPLAKIDHVFKDQHGQPVNRAPGGNAQRCIAQRRADLLAHSVGGLAQFGQSRCDWEFGSRTSGARAPDGVRQTAYRPHRCWKSCPIARRERRRPQPRLRAVPQIPLWPVRPTTPHGSGSADRARHD